MEWQGATSIQGNVSLIGVKKEYQHKGIGIELLNATLSLIKDQKMKFVRLEVDKDNKKAYNFYRRNDFIVIEDREKTFLMEKKI